MDQVCGPNQVFCCLNTNKLQLENIKYKMKEGLMPESSEGKAVNPAS